MFGEFAARMRSATPGPNDAARAATTTTRATQDGDEQNSDQGPPVWSNRTAAGD